MKRGEFIQMNQGVTAKLMVHYPELGKLVQELNQNVFNKPHTTIIKSRIYAERMIELIINEHSQQPTGLLTYQERIDFVKTQQVIDHKVYQAFDKVRRIGNIAAHGELEDEVGEALKVNRHIFTLSCWFIEMYCDQTFIQPEYVTPVPHSELEIDDRLIESVLAKLHHFEEQPVEKPTETLAVQPRPSQRAGKHVLAPTDVIPEGKYAGKVVADVHRQHPFYFADWFVYNKQYTVDFAALMAIYQPTPQQCEKHKAQQTKGKIILTLADVFPEGKYAGQSIRAVHQQRPDYIKQWFNKNKRYYVELDEKGE